MSWEPGEIVLVIATSATAITSVAGVGIPLFRDWWTKKWQAKEAQYRSLSSAVFGCAEKLDLVTKGDRDQQIALAIVSAGVPIDPPAKEISDAQIAFNAHLNMIKLLAPEIGIDPKPFTGTARRVRILSPKFTYSNGILEEEGDHMADIGELVSAEAKLIDEGVELLRAARKKLGLEK